MKGRLTVRREKFAQAVADGKSLSDAYRQAFSVSKMKIDTIHQKAWEISKKVEVMERIEELRTELESRALWTREQSVKALVAVVEAPDKASDVIAAVKELNAMHGYNAPQKSEVALSGGVVLIPAKNAN